MSKNKLKRGLEALDLIYQQMGEDKFNRSALEDALDYLGYGSGDEAIKEYVKKLKRKGVLKVVTAGYIFRINKEKLENLKNILEHKENKEDRESDSFTSISIRESTKKKVKKLKVEEDYKNYDSLVREEIFNE